MLLLVVIVTIVIAFMPSLVIMRRHQLSLTVCNCHCVVLLSIMLVDFQFCSVLIWY